MLRRLAAPALAGLVVTLTSLAAAAAPGDGMPMPPKAAAPDDGRFQVAQEWSPFRGLIRLFGGDRPEPRYQPGADPRYPVRSPPPQRVRPARPRPERVIRLESEETKPDKTKAPDAQVVLVIGDSLGGSLASGLEVTYAERTDVVVVSKTRGSSGIVRDDYYDWNAALPQILAEVKPAAIVVMVGANDRQPLYAAGGRIVERLQSPRWEEVYVERVTKLAAQLKAAGKPFTWVALPPTSRSEFGAFLAGLNDLVKPVVQQQGGGWVDIWDAFTDDDGHYTSSGPDVEGEVRRLRTSDGIHFTKSGQRKLAFFVEAELGKVLRSTPPPGAVGEAAEPAPEGAPEEPQPPAVATMPDPAEPQMPPWLRVGPIVPLTEPAGGTQELAGAVPPQPGEPVEGDPTRRRLIAGEAIDTPVGRADDFRWPAAAPATLPPTPAAPPSGPLVVAPPPVTSSAPPSVALPSPPRRP